MFLSKQIDLTSDPMIRLGIVVVVLLFAGSRNADGSCGDYLLVNGVPVSQHQGAAMHSDRDGGSPVDEIPSRRECKGPHCSQSPTVPPPISSTVQSSLQLKLSALASAAIAASRQSQRVPVELERVAGMCFANQVFRPPRASLCAWERSI